MSVAAEGSRGFLAHVRATRAAGSRSLSRPDAPRSPDATCADRSVGTSSRARRIPQSSRRVESLASWTHGLDAELRAAIALASDPELGQTVAALAAARQQRPREPQADLVPQKADVIAERIDVLAKTVSARAQLIASGEGLAKARDG